MSWNEGLRYQLNVANDAVKSAYICQLEIMHITYKSDDVSWKTRIVFFFHSVCFVFFASVCMLTKLNGFVFFKAWMQNDSVRMLKQQHHKCLSKMMKRILKWNCVCKHQSSTHFHSVQTLYSAMVICISIIDIVD